jgi:hypothetical protein
MIGNKFEPDDAVLSDYPDVPVWEVIRECPNWTVCGGLSIDNRMRNKWWCKPEHGEGSLEVMFAFDCLEKVKFV